MAIDPVTVFVAGFVFVVLAQALVFGYGFAKYVNLFARFGMITRPLGIDRWAGVGATVLFLVGFGWLAAVGSLPDEGEPMRYPVLLAILGFGAGLFCVALAVSNFGRYRRIRDGEAVAGVAESEGEQTVRAPLSGEPCLAWAVRVREHSGLFRRGGPPPIHRGSDGTTFAVRSTLERVRVDASEASLDVWPVAGWASSDFVTRERGEVPDRVSAYATDADLGDPDRSRVYEEARIEPGDHVTVFGAGGETAADGPETVVVDRGGETVRRQLRRRVGAGPAGGALALVCFGVAALLSGAV